MFFIKKQKRIIIKYLALFVLLFLLTPFFSNAEILTPQDNVYIKMKPEFPGVNQLVTINLEGYVIDLNQSEISWFKNNRLQEKGVGKTNYSFETKGLGSLDIIMVRIETPESGTITKNVTINPAEVDLIWESDSSTPPFYKGKALNSYQSNVRVIAIPSFISSNGFIYNSKKLIYKWKQDWKVLDNDSGYGKDVLVLDGTDLPKDRNITVEVRTLDNKIISKASIDINNQSPEIVFYEKNPVFGTIYNKALTSQFELKNEEITIIAYPFFFSKKDIINNRLKYSWIMNNNKINDLSLMSTITLKQSGDTGITNLYVEVQNLNRIMQFAKNSFSVNFSGIGQTESFFGVNNF